MFFSFYEKKKIILWFELKCLPKAHVLKGWVTSLWSYGRWWRWCLGDRAQWEEVRSLGACPSSVSLLCFMAALCWTDLLCHALPPWCTASLQVWNQWDQATTKPAKCKPKNLSSFQVVYIKYFITQTPSLIPLPSLWIYYFDFIRN